ncbi:winged helix-turn-helix transcriptional regulator [Homoserinimonas sp. A520]
MRSYSDACGLARALDLVGERWALLVIRELVVGSKRYTDLVVSLPGVSTNILSSRLSELEQAGIVARRKLPPPTPVSVYELTAWGKELEPAILALGRWGARTTLDLSTQSLSPASFVLSLRTNFSGTLAEGVQVRFGTRLDDQRFVGVIDHSGFAIEQDQQAPVDVEISGDPKSLAAVFYAGASLQAAVDAGSLTVSGDRKVLPQIVGCFPLPDKPTLEERMQP